MKKTILCLSAIALAACLMTVETGAVNSVNVINSLKLSEKDLPDGFMFGKVPGFAKKVLKDNPWMMDRGAIKKLASRIYPGGDYNKIQGMHMTIMSKKRNPYGDDIVCYIILYRDAASAKDEIKKISSFAEFNRDRVIVIVKENMAVYLHVDNTDDFHHIRNMAENMKKKIGKT